MKDKIIEENVGAQNSSAAFGLDTVAKPNKTAYAFEKIFSHYTTNIGDLTNVTSVTGGTF